MFVAGPAIGTVYCFTVSLPIYVDAVHTYIRTFLMRMNRYIYGQKTII